MPLTFADGSSTQFCSFEASNIAKLLQRHVAAHHKRRREVTQALYDLSQQLAVPSTPASSGSNRKTWEVVWRQCCTASAGVFSMTSGGSLTSHASPSFTAPAYAERSNYWSSFGFAGGSPNDASPSSLAAAALAVFCETKPLELQGMLNGSGGGYPFCSTFLAVAGAVFELMGLADMHRHMNLLDAPNDPPLLQYLCR